MVTLKSQKLMAAIYNCYIKIVLWQFTFFYSVWGCMGPRSGVDTFKERRMSCFCQEVYSSHCTDCTTVCCI